MQLKEEKQDLVYTYLMVLLSQASTSAKKANAKYLLFTLTGKFVDLLIVKQVLC